MFETLRKRTPVTVRRPRKPRFSSHEAEQAVLEALKHLEGEEVRLEDLAELLGYRDKNPVALVVRRLRAKGTITRVGNKNHYTYRVNRGQVYRKRNGRAPRGENQQRVLGWIQRHPEQLVPQSDIAHSLRLPQASVSRAIISLEASGLIERSDPTKDGSRYRAVVESTVAEPEPEKVSDEGAVDSSPSTKNEQSLKDFIDSQVWEFIKTTRSTDVLVFLDWLDKK